MGFFDFMQGSKHKISVLKNESAPGVIVWKHDEEDFNTNSELVLSPGESAVFVYTNKDGQTEYEVLNKGGFLKTNNYPFLRSVTNIVSGGVSFFHCAVYFIRTNVLEMNNTWGTKSQLGPFEDVTHYTFKIAANGSYMYKIIDPGKLLNNVLGYEETTVMQDKISNGLRDLIEMEVASLLGNFFRHPEMKASIERVLMNLLKDMSAAIMTILNEKHGTQWGINISNFTISLNMCVDELPDDILETNRQMRQYRASKAMGAFYDKDQIYRMMHEMSTMESGSMGNMVGMGAGIGIGNGIGGSIGNQIKDLMNNGMLGTSGNIMRQPDNHSNNDGWGGNPIMIDPEEKKQKNRQERKERLAELREYFENGDITQEEYAEQKRIILSGI